MGNISWKWKIYLLMCFESSKLPIMMQFFLKKKFVIPGVSWMISALALVLDQDYY